ncbi:MAG: hypothetical protein WC241_02100 [Candidatus Paceibacterota bacterium]|jgi:hypothetical protein
MKTTFYIFFSAQLVGFLGSFGKMLHDSISNAQSLTGGNVSKETLITLGILFAVGCVGFAVSNELVDQLNKIEADAESKAKAQGETKMAT